MASYLLQVGYTPEAWAAMISNPQDRSAAIKTPVEKLGGRVERFWLSFGDYDVIGVVEMPDSVSAAAFSMAVAAGGACRAVRTTPLLSSSEGLEAMKKAATCGYNRSANPLKRAVDAARQAGTASRFRGNAADCGRCSFIEIGGSPLFRVTVARWMELLSSTSRRAGPRMTWSIRSGGLRGPKKSGTWGRSTPPRPVFCRW